MSSVPAEISGIGSTAQKLRVTPGFDPLKASVGPEEYFVLSRIDGSQSLRDVLLATGLPIDRAIQIVTRLRSIGALLLPAEPNPAPRTPVPSANASGAIRTAVPQVPRTITPVATARTPTPGTPAASRTPTPGAPAPSRTMTPMRRAASGTAPTDTEGPRVFDLELPNPRVEELSALAEHGELDDRERRRILAIARLVETHDPYTLLGAPYGADAKTLKRAYFRLSKEIHPDRYYGRQLGSFALRLETVFEAVSRAYAQLTQPKPASATHRAVGQANDQPQTPQEYASELFERACGLEVSGDALEAMKLFAAAVRVDPQTRYLRRAATCALAAKQPKTALEYAKKAQAQAPDDPSSARLLAAAFRATGRLADAEEVLVMAMAMKSENDVLGAELRNDLAEVRCLLGPHASA